MLRKPAVATISALGVTVPLENARCSKGDLRFLIPLIILERQFAYHPLRVLLAVLQ